MIWPCVVYELYIFVHTFHWLCMNFTVYEFYSVWIGSLQPFFAIVASETNIRFYIFYYIWWFVQVIISP